MTLADYAAQYEREAALKRATLANALRKVLAESDLPAHEQSGVLQSLAYEKARVALGGNGAVAFPAGLRNVAP